MAKAQGLKEKIEYRDADPDVPSRWDTDSYVSLYCNVQKFVSFVFTFRIINPAKAMTELSWRPRHVGFLEEIDTYYKAWAAHKSK